MRLLIFLIALAASAQDFAAQFEQIKKTATNEQLYALLYSMPKGGDLHHHLTLAPLPEEWWQAAMAPGRDFYARVRFHACPDSAEPFLRWATVPKFRVTALSECAQKEWEPLRTMSPETRQQWLDAMRLDRPTEGRNEFFDVIVNRLVGMVRDPDTLADAIALYLQRYGREGILYVESQTGMNPTVDHQGRPVSREQVGDKLRAMLARPEVQASGVTVRFQVTAIRFAPNAEEQIERAHEFVDRNRDYWVGVNIAGREDNDKGNTARLLSTFRKMRRQYSGIRLALHGGEVDSPGPDVRNTLLLGAERIGHGFNLITDPDTMLLLRNGKTLIEVNLVSNKLLEYVSRYEQHPFPEYLRFGIPVALSTDDPGCWDSNLTDEFFTAVREYNLTWPEIVQLGRNSLQFSFAPDAVKRDLLARFETRIRNFELTYRGGDWAERLAAVRPAVSNYARRELLK